MIHSWVKKFRKYAGWGIAAIFLAICVSSHTYTKNERILTDIAQESKFNFKQNDAPKPTSVTLEPLFAAPLTAGALKEEAIDIAVQLTKDFSNSADAVFLLGNVYRNQGNSTMAVKCWERYLELNPDHAEAYDGMGWVAFQKAEYQKAVELWHRVLEINPRLPGVYESLACALICLGRAEEAIMALQKNIEISEKPINSYFMLGKQYLLLKEYEKAKKCYETVIRMQPAHVSAYYGLATACERLGQKDKFKDYIEKFKELKAGEMQALKARDSAFDDLVSLRRNVAQTHTRIGQFYYVRKNSQKAEELLRRAATLDPKHSDCRILLASLYQQDGRVAQALQLHEQLAMIEPHNTVHHGNVGVLSVQLQRFDRAEKAFRKAIDLAPKQSFGYQYIAYLYLTMNRKLPEARKLAEKAVALEKTGENFFILSRACNVNGDRASAMSAIQQAIKLEPNNIKYRQMYEQLKRGY
ncbi:tetratricopeptide repeat protein [bacterium]|nr:tetratricopeptide repeat protein [bacterium]